MTKQNYNYGLISISHGTDGHVLVPLRVRHFGATTQIDVYDPNRPCGSPDTPTNHPPIVIHGDKWSFPFDQSHTWSGSTLNDGLAYIPYTSSSGWRAFGANFTGILEVVFGANTQVQQVTDSQGQKLYIEGTRTVDTSGRRQYKDLQMPHAERIQLLQKLVGVINTYMDFGYIVSVDTIALQEVAKQLRPILSDDERASMEKNAFCLLNLLRLVFNSGVQHDGVSVLVDDSGKSMNTYGAYRTVKARYPHWRDHLSAITFGDDRFIQGLQAADLLANAVTRDYRRATEPGPIAAPTLQELFDLPGGARIRYVADHWKRERLEELARFMMSSHSPDTLANSAPTC